MNALMLLRRAAYGAWPSQHRPHDEALAASWSCQVRACVPVKLGNTSHRAPDECLRARIVLLITSPWIASLEVLFCVAGWPMPAPGAIRVPPAVTDDLACFA